MALKHRSVSWPSDEALCVATLMSVPLPDVSFVLPTSDAEAKIYKDEEVAKDAAKKAKDALQLDLDAHPVGSPLLIQALAVYTSAAHEAKEAANLADIYRKKADSDLHIARMQELWLFLSTSLSGLPAGLIFFPEARISNPGFRWALLTFFAAHSAPFDRNMRLHHWKGKHLGRPSPYGLLVENPGFRLSESVYADGLPRHPWKGCTRVSNHSLLVRGPEGELHRVSADPNGVEVAETIPLPDLELTGSYAVLMQREIHAGAPLPETACMGLLVRVATTEEREVDGSSEFFGGAEILGITKRRLLISRLQASEELLFNTLEAPATQLRSSALTVSLQSSTSDSKRREAIDELKAEMKRMMSGAYETVPGLRDTVISTYGDVADHIWGLIGDWYHHDFVIAMLSPKQ